MKKTIQFLYAVLFSAVLVACGGGSGDSEPDPDMPPTSEDGQVTLIGSWRQNFSSGYIVIYFDRTGYGWSHEYDKDDGGWYEKEYFDYNYKSSKKALTIIWDDGYQEVMQIRSLTNSKLVIRQEDGETITLQRLSYDEVSTGKDEESGDENDDPDKPNDSDDSDNTERDESLNPEGFVPPADYKGVYLGGSVNWAEYNVGANDPLEPGGRYGWGDITGSYYTKDLNRYPSANPPSNISGTEHDIVTKKWGNGWRMPTKEEVQELLENCSVSWSSNRQAWELRGSGKSIYIPYAPVRAGKTFYDECGYWTGTLNSETGAAYALFTLKAAESLNSINSFARYYGMAIRPVKKVDYGFDYKNLSYIIDGKTYKMILVDGGSLPPFYIMQTEIPLNGYLQFGDQYVGVINTNGDNGIIKAELRTFINKIREVTGLEFRLPTVAEWQFAAQGGAKGSGCTYSGSNNIDDVAWYNNNSGNKGHDIATKQPNELGLYDMSGNYAEVCSNDHYDIDGQLCGGCWKDTATNCKSTSVKSGDTSSNTIPGTSLKEKNAVDGRYITVRLVYSVPKALED